MPFVPSWPQVERDSGASECRVILWSSDRDNLERLARSLFPDFPLRWNLSHVVRVALARAAKAIEDSERAARLSD